MASSPVSIALVMLFHVNTKFRTPVANGDVTEIVMQQTLR